MYATSTIQKNIAKVNNGPIVQNFVQSGHPGADTTRPMPILHLRTKFKLKIPPVFDESPHSAKTLLKKAIIDKTVNGKKLLFLEHLQNIG
jgi:hypothetical protein